MFEYEPSPTRRQWGLEPGYCGGPLPSVTVPECCALSPSTQVSETSSPGLLPPSIEETASPESSVWPSIAMIVSPAARPARSAAERRDDARDDGA